MTLSYDDGQEYDAELIERLNRYQIPATFNVNYKSFENQMAKGITQQELIDRYAGHEVANHSYSHPNWATTGMSNAEYLEDVKKGRERLEAMFGTSITGFAWPHSKPTTAEKADIVTGIEASDVLYIRDSGSGHTWELPEDFMDWNCTTHQSSWETYYNFFKADGSRELQLFSV